MRRSNVLNLGIKELRSLYRDVALLLLIAWAFTLGVYTAASSMPESLHHASLAVVDEDRSPLSMRIINAFQPPFFLPPQLIDLNQMDRGMDAGDYTFTLNIPPNFQRDLLAGRQPTAQLNVDATQVSQAFTGAGYIQSIAASEIAEFLQRHRGGSNQAVELEMRVAFNPNLTRSWFGSVMEVINQITMLSIILTGAALIREREHGTVEHLLVMPVTPFEIMLSKVWSMGVVVLIASSFSLQVVVKGVLGVVVPGSAVLFGAATLLYLFAAASIGVFMGTLARNMPQFGLMSILVLLPLQILSGALTPRESMPDVVSGLMSLTPTTHFVSLAQGVLFRGAGIDVVWPEFLMVAAIGTLFFALAHHRLRSTIGKMQG